MRLLVVGCIGLFTAFASPGQLAAAPRSASQVITADSVALAAFFDGYDKAQLAVSPTSKAIRGIVDEDYSRWDDFSAAAEPRRQSVDANALTELRATFERGRLSPADQLSYDLFESAMSRSAAAFRYRGYGYLFNQMNGIQSRLPGFLINTHRVTDVATAEAYVSRLASLDTVLDQSIAKARKRAAAGVQPPRWVYPYVIRDAKAVISGAPFDAGPDSPLFADVKKKVSALAVSDETKARLIESARNALLTDVQPAYERVIALMQQHQAQAGDDDGVWRLAGGADYYAERLGFHTNTALTADEIHALGLKEVARIQGEMRAIMRQVGFAGSLQAFFNHTRTDPRFFHPTRAAYLAEVETHNAAVARVLPRYFGRLPKDRLVVKEVEPYREKSATKAFYEAPAPDGSRPGSYYVNLFDLKSMSKNEVEALFYHEGIPGHHLQLSIQTGLGDLPAFRRFGFYSAYIEGWGLYAERLGKDMGFYADPYADLGRLSMEILRAGRLVVDTGIHAKRWSREQAVDWFMENTPVTAGDIQNQVERYVVNPGQATAYTIGKLKIEELRARSEVKLGRKFDIRQFHDVVLNAGPVPLDILERNVEAWITARSTR